VDCSADCSQQQGAQAAAEGEYVLVLLRKEQEVGREVVEGAV
jgi:hypothetical protein